MGSPRASSHLIYQLKMLHHQEQLAVNNRCSKALGDVKVIGAMNMQNTAPRSGRGTELKDRGTTLSSPHCVLQGMGASMALLSTG